MRLPLLSVMIPVLVACNVGGEQGGQRSGSLLSSSGGEVHLADGNRLEFAITSENYKKWDSARRGIDRRVSARFGALLQPSAPTERSIDRAVAYLESEPAARQAIERSGMSVRAFVVTTVALEQEMRLASGQGSRSQEPAPAETSYEFPTYDSTLIFRQHPPVPVAHHDTFSRADSAASSPRLDTVFTAPPRRDSLPPPTIFRRDSTVRRDSTIRRDTQPTAPRPIRRDTQPAAPRPVIRDTIRDTIHAPPPPIPPDTLRNP
jgi:hypothetical protein